MRTTIQEKHGRWWKAPLVVLVGLVGIIVGLGLAAVIMRMSQEVLILITALTLAVVFSLPLTVLNIVLLLRQLSERRQVEIKSHKQVDDPYWRGAAPAPTILFPMMPPQQIPPGGYQQSPAPSYSVRKEREFVVVGGEDV
jgi:hypothetical protein